MSRPSRSLPKRTRCAVAVVRLLRVVFVAFVALLAAPARPARAEDRCSVARKCSSEGVFCSSSDRACLEKARERALEVVCDVPKDGETWFVYCPPLTTTRDSGVVWILLVVASVLAVGGTAATYFALKKKA